MFFTISYCEKKQAKRGGLRNEGWYKTECKKKKKNTTKNTHTQKKHKTNPSVFCNYKTME